MKQKIDKGRFKFIEAWVWPEKIEDFVKEILQRLSIKDEDLCHCFSGKSTIGGLRIDIARENNPDIVSDVRELPDKLGAGSQKNVIADPPWEIPYHMRRYFSYAMRDLTQMGGYVIINAPWFPWVTGLELIECWQVVQAFNSYRDVVSFWIFKRVPDGTPCYQGYDESLIRLAKDQRSVLGRSRSAKSRSKLIRSGRKKPIKVEKTDQQPEKE